MKFGSRRNIYRGYAHSNVAKTNLLFAKFQCTTEPTKFKSQLNRFLLLRVRGITTGKWPLLVCSYCDSGTEFDELGEHSFGQD